MKYPCLKNILVAIALANFAAACKDGGSPKDGSRILADATDEVKNTAAFYKASWDQEFAIKFSELPLSGEATATPYSGHWYPEVVGGTNIRNDAGGSALEKYDRAFYQGVNRAALWEANNHAASDTQWAGHCNGLSAAAARHGEPTRPVVRNGIRFEAYDIKALLAEIYMGGNYFFLGGMRCQSVNDQAPNPDLDREFYHIMGECEDVNPGTFHVSLANWVGKLGKSLVFDLSRNNQVWNYPLYRYASTAKEVSADEALAVIGSRQSAYVFNPKATKLLQVYTSLTYADALPEEQAPAGVHSKVVHVEYIIEVNDQGEIIGGEWAFNSRNDHPDFIWAPLEPMQGIGHRGSGNPYLKVEEVLEMWAESAGYSSLASAPKQLEGGSWTSHWGQYSDFSVTIDGSARGSVFLSDAGNRFQIKRDSGFPKLSLELNSASATEQKDEENIQTFSISPVPGINWATISYTVNGKKNSETLLMHAIR